AMRPQLQDWRRDPPQHPQRREHHNASQQWPHLGQLKPRFIEPFTLREQRLL
ncbi:hypothetical protein BGZ88_012604, partial [Linnemannia elongata]